jgi:hypothetical protein
MNGKASILLSGLVAILMVTCAIPFMASEDSDALIGNTTGMSLNVSKAILYEEDGDDSIDLEITETPEGVSASAATWYFNDLNDGDDFVELSDYTGSTTTVSVSPDGLGNMAQASVEVVASITVGAVTHTASAVIVVYPSPDTPTTTFHFLIQIDSDAFDYVEANCVNQDQSTPCVDTGMAAYDYDDFTDGVWITVTWNSNMGITFDDFTAYAALEWYLTTNGWPHDIGAYGWIGQLLGLETYEGPAVSGGNIWYYWAQYHLTNSGWDFNNETLDFITGVGSSYIALVFWASPPTMAPPQFLDPTYP